MSRPVGHSSERSRRGVALLAVLLLVVLMEVLLADMVCVSALSRRSAGNYSRELQNVAAADGAVRAVADALSRPTADEVLPSLLKTGVPDLRLGASVSRATFQDEDGKVNVNLLADPNEAVADGCSRDIDTLLRMAGHTDLRSEAIRRRAAAVPGGLTTLVQLRGVGGLTDALIFGATAREAAGGPAPLADFLTCSSEGRVNINTAPEVVVRALFSARAPDLADAVIEARRDSPITYLVEIPGFLQIDPDARAYLQERLCTESATYSMTVWTGTGGLLAISRAVGRLSSDGSGFRFQSYERIR